jgi:hypothetical protein
MLRTSFGEPAAKGQDNSKWDLISTPSSAKNSYLTMSLLLFMEPIKDVDSWAVLADRCGVERVQVDVRFESWIGKLILS